MKTDLRTINGWELSIQPYIPEQLKNQWLICITSGMYDDAITESLCQVLIGMKDGTIAFRNGKTDGQWNSFTVKQWV